MISADRVFLVRAVTVAPLGSVEVDLPVAQPSLHRSFAIQVPHARLGHHRALLTFEIVHPATAKERERVYDVTIRVVYDGLRHWQ